MPNIIVITGPCGAGKTTVSGIVAKELGIQHLKADDVTHELFPGLESIEQHPKELQQMKDEVLRRAKEFFDNGKSVVVDFVVLGDFISDFQRTFGDDLVMRALLPRIEVTIARDTSRDCWTVGEKHVRELHDMFIRDRELIGAGNFIDTSDETAEKTAERITNGMKKWRFGGPSQEMREYIAKANGQ